jgi:hypothetical protein
MWKENLKTGRKEGTLSILRPLYSSSSATSTSPFLDLTVTGAISGLKWPAFQAASARRYLYQLNHMGCRKYDSIAKASCASLENPSREAVFSAHIPI